MCNQMRCGFADMLLGSPGFLGSVLLLLLLPLLLLLLVVPPSVLS